MEAPFSGGWVQYSFHGFVGIARDILFWAKSAENPMKWGFEATSAARASQKMATNLVKFLRIIAASSKGPRNRSRSGWEQGNLLRRSAAIQEFRAFYVYIGLNWECGRPADISRWCEPTRRSPGVGMVMVK